MSEEERRELIEAGTRARQQQAQSRRDAEESGKLGLKALLGKRLEERADAITKRLEALALSEEDSIALRGIELWLARVHGKAVQPTQEIAPDLPSEVAALHSMPPEERRALLRSLSTPPAH